MKIKITRGNSARGKILEVVTDPSYSMEAASAHICGTRNNGTSNLLLDHSWFHFGGESKYFCWEKRINLETDSPTEIEAEIKSRIAVIREWVAENDWSETFSFEV